MVKQLRRQTPRDWSPDWNLANGAWGNARDRRSADSRCEIPLSPANSFEERCWEVPPPWRRGTELGTQGGHLEDSPITLADDSSVMKQNR